MTRLLILILIIVGIFVLIYSVLKGLAGKFLRNLNNNKNKTQSENEKRKSKIIYEHDDVVVMKGDAANKQEKKYD